jgi:carbon storage regulator
MEASPMLVLTRRVGEVIYIDSDIVIKVAEVRGNRVKLAIDAPEHVRVDRKEVRDRALCAAEQLHGES